MLTNNVESNFKETHLYPVRCRYIRLHSMRDYNAITNFRDGGSEFVSTQKAFIFELFAGKYDIETITKIFSGTFNIDLQKANECIRDVINEYVSHITMFTHTVETGLSCNPMRVLKKSNIEWKFNRLRYEIPEEFSLSLTYLCNHRCIYCCNSSAKRMDDELSVNDWIKLIDEAAAFGVQAINFSGGEPLMYPDFIKLVKRTTDKGMYPIISTNGTFISAGVANQLADAGVDFVHLSMSATEDILYDEIVGHKGNLPIVKAAIKELKKNKIYIRLKMVLMPVNINAAEELLDFCVENGVDCVHLAPFILTHISRNGDELIPSLNNLTKLKTLVDKKKEQFNNAITILGPSVDDLRWKDASDIVKCGGIKSKLTILPNGNITLCEALGSDSNFIMGNVRTSSIKEIWCSDVPDKVNMINMNVVEEPCKSCEHLEGCRTGCFMCSLIYSCNPYAVDPRCWKATIKNNAYKS